VIDLENPTHFGDWLKRFEIPVLYAAPKISEKGKAMVLATKLSTDAFAEFRPKTSQTTITKRQWQDYVFSLANNAPYLPTVTTACASLVTKGKNSCT
jgi:hypothetical protein